MQVTLKEMVKNACLQCSSLPIQNLSKFCTDTLSQIALLGIQLIWTIKVTEALEKTGRNENKNAMEQKRREINEMMTILSAMCLQDWKPMARTKVETLVTIHVHQRDIAAELKCKDVNDFDWQKQTRIYWRSDPTDNCIISITDFDQAYSYEYLGSKERLCITPLTDRCYITLAQALSMHYGGAPAGPAGTGKTETVKDLGRTLGVFVVVTNCSD
jgi:dynein heavy chain